MKTQKTFAPKAQPKAEKKWHLVNAENQVLGRLSSKIAVLLRGKNKATYAPNVDMGDYVVVINAEKVKLTGNKESQKEYFSHSGYLGHLKRKSIAQVRVTQPKRIIEECVAGMIPHNRLKKFILRKLYIYAGDKHPHGGQKLIEFKI
jgi:large subunit ribosomal protein L13